MTPSEPVIEVRGFSFAVGSKAILRRVSFAVGRGEYATIVGPNGAGKTTLLRCLIRTLRGGDGEIRIAGRPLGDYGQKELARRVGYVPQAFGHALPYTAREMVMMGRYPYLSPFSPISKRDRAVVDDVLCRTGTAEFADRPLGTLSGGERQKVFIAAALAQQAEILLLDEPATFLDYRHQAEIRGLLRRVGRESCTTVLCVTHDVNAAALESDRIVALCEGSVVFDGPPRELMRPEVLERIYGVPLLTVAHPTAGLPMIVPLAASQ